MEDLAYIHLAWNKEAAQAIDADEVIVPENSTSAPVLAWSQMMAGVFQPVLDSDRDYADVPGFCSDLYPTIYF